MLLQLTTAQTLGRHPTIAREGRVYLAGPPTLAMPPSLPDLTAPFCSLSGPLCPAEQASLQFINKPCSRPLQDLSPEPSPRPEHPSHEHPSSALNSSTASSGADALPQPCGPRCPEQPSALPGVRCHHLLNDQLRPPPESPARTCFPSLLYAWPLGQRCRAPRVCGTRTRLCAASSPGSRWVMTGAAGV